MSEPVEKVIDVAADVAAEVAQQAEGVEKVIRSLNQVKVAYASLGAIIGATASAIIAYKVAHQRAETKYGLLAAEEIAEMREHYNEKVVALNLEASKGDLEDLVRDRGYVSPESESETPPMAITPPKAVVDAAQEAAEKEVDAALLENAAEREDETRRPAPEVRNVFRENEPPKDTWDWHEERRKRSPMTPYVIHIDERDDNAAYESVTLTYYEADDVVCNERDEVIAQDQRERVFGEANLEKFGHGSNDANIVYIRNDDLEMDIEIVRSPNSYMEEVHGFEPEEPEIRHAHRRVRASIDDE